MKKLKILMIFVAFILIISSVSSCGLLGDLNGTYVSKEHELGYHTTYKFSGDTVTYSFAGKSMKGKYKIVEDTLKIKLDVLGGIDHEYDFKKDGDTLIIGGNEYVKK